jgi:hypothetical protein
MTLTNIGFIPEEIDIAAPTRAARLKWVVVVDSSLPAGRAVNAAVCVAAAAGAHVGGLLGPEGTDATGAEHVGLPWAGCSILAADPSQLAELRARAAAADDVWVADMPEDAQATRVYADYLAALGETTEPRLLAVGIVGPRNRIDRLTKRLSLLP